MSLNTDVTWPQGHRAAAIVTVNFEAESVERQSADLPFWGRSSHGRYGAQQGIYNLLGLFSRFGVRATFFISAWDVERYPAAMEAIASAGHETAGYGYLYEDLSILSDEEQVALLERSETIFERTFGRKPLGFRAPGRRLAGSTRGLLAERGYHYDSSYSDDDRPYVVDKGGNRLVELPTHEPWSDRPYYEKHRVPSVVAGSLLDEFDAVYSEGLLFTLAINPRGDVGSGRGGRTRAISPLLQSLREHSGTWVATCDEVAQWVLRGTQERVLVDRIGGAD